MLDWPTDLGNPTRRADSYDNVQQTYHRNNGGLDNILVALGASFIKTRCVSRPVHRVFQPQA